MTNLSLKPHNRRGGFFFKCFRSPVYKVSPAEDVRRGCFERDLSLDYQWEDLDHESFSTVCDEK